MITCGWKHSFQKVPPWINITISYGFLIFLIRYLGLCNIAQYRPTDNFWSVLKHVSLTNIQDIRLNMGGLINETSKFWNLLNSNVRLNFGLSWWSLKKTFDILLNHSTLLGTSPAPPGSVFFYVFPLGHNGSALQASKLWWLIPHGIVII